MIIVLFVHGVNNEQVCVDYCYFPFRLQRKRVSATLNGHDEQRVVSQRSRSCHTHSLPGAFSPRVTLTTWTQNEQLSTIHVLRNIFLVLWTEIREFRVGVRSYQYKCIRISTRRSIVQIVGVNRLLSLIVRTTDKQQI
jgi:hypothetical protein